ncbi:MAG: hypothetical protein ACLFVN_09115 [Phycisphaeraceae bacterium]
MSDRPAEERKYYVRLGGRVTGPVGLARLKSMRAQRTLSRVHELSEDGRRWTPVSRFPELAGEAGTHQVPPSQSRDANEADFSQLDQLADAAGRETPGEDEAPASPERSVPAGAPLAWWTGGIAAVLLLAGLLPDARTGGGLGWWWDVAASPGGAGRLVTGLALTATGVVMLAVTIAGAGRRRGVISLAGLAMLPIMIGGLLRMPAAAAWIVAGVWAGLSAGLLAKWSRPRPQGADEPGCAPALAGLSLSLAGLVWLVLPAWWRTGDLPIGWPALNWCVASLAAAAGVLGVADAIRAGRGRWAFAGAAGTLVGIALLAMVRLGLAVHAAPAAGRFEVLWMARLFAGLFSLVLLTLVAAGRRQEEDHDRHTQ